VVFDDVGVRVDEALESEVGLSAPLLGLGGRPRAFGEVGESVPDPGLKGSQIGDSLLFVPECLDDA
jgi:hypothetical protein